MNALTHAPRNAGPWRAIAEFLDAQHLALFGLVRLPTSGAGRAGTELAKAGAAPRSAPLGNHGDNTFKVGK